MFTGIIKATGYISSVEQKAIDSRFIFDVSNMELSDLAIGDSIAVNGVCLTMIEKQNNFFSADLSKETLDMTTFSKLNQGDRVNLEKAMRLSDRLNGHLVSGHVDDIGKVVDKFDEGKSVRYAIAVPSRLTKFISRKGSVTIDGVSLTVNQSEANTFTVNIIPHTLSETIFSEYKAETSVNIEVDLIARYLEQLINK